jgi:hypothetical protein
MNVFVGKHTITYIYSMFFKRTVFSILLGCGILSCRFPHQPTQFVLPQNPYTFPIAKTVLDWADSAINVKIAFTLRDGSRAVYFVDFNDMSASLKKLKKPAAKTDFNADSPIISPDGRFVTYYLIQGGAIIEGAYIQKLDESADPVLIAENGAEPHFWVDPQGQTYIIYSDNFQVGELSLGNGKTYKRKVSLSGSGAPDGDPVVIAPYPMNGGLSKNGQILCTGYYQAAFYSLADSVLTPVNSGVQVCNPSIDPDGAHSDWMMFLNYTGAQNLSNPFKNSADYPAIDALGTLPMHVAMLIVDMTNTVRDFVPISLMGGGYAAWQDPEWSNDPRFAAALAMIDESQADLVIIKNIGDRTALKETLVLTLGTGKMNETSTPYVWIGR